MTKDDADTVAADLRALGYDATRNPSDSYVPYASDAPVTYNVIVWNGRRTTNGGIA